MSKNPVVVVDSFTKVYGDGTKIGPISLHVYEGEVYGLVGPNGSGKTTTLRAILGLLKPSGGKVSVYGLNPYSHPEKANQKIGYSPEIPNYPPFFTAEKLLRVTCSMKKIFGKDADNEVRRVLDLTGLVNHADRKIGNFSKGMVQRLSIGQALVGDPPLLVLDEPMLGVDPVGRAHIRDVLTQLRKQGKTIIFSSHELYEVQRLSDRVAMVYRGKTVFEDMVMNLLNNSSHTRVVAELAAEPDGKLAKALEEITGVLKVAIEANRVVIHVDSSLDPREKIAEKIVKLGYGLREFRLSQPSLEEVFINRVRESVGG
ncbi:ABC-2 type transport system ATP-binding protein [Candidatus Caldarchaeum subterraneum]|uniref:ABC-2 type transport system ATP-binding protein n=1 Tax=Caldiarchaeum subterraneum TaxID=311458 RepID=E6N549_CALS0|nr:ABC-2 type transport system ATP-binding protein [Candidatus Caldarchaeum subterraneum]BAJ50252.1 ABC-2 type transport system ATP-binding protein [Candidatus Caldarchaeum subterraneum]